MRPKESHYLFLGLIAEELIHRRVPKIDPAAEPTYAEQEVLPLVRQLDQVQATTEEEFLNSNRLVSTNAAPLPQEIVFEEEV